jgi:hypothetical protein
MTNLMLYINDLPVGCLLTNSLSESISFIKTCKSTQEMGQKQLGQLHSYSVNFEAVYAVDQAIIGWNDLKDLGRSRTIMDWSMINLDTNEGDAGEGFLENLEITGTSEDFIKFAGTITGYGAIVDSNVVYYVWAQDDDIKNVEVMSKHFKNKPDNIVKTYSTAGGVKKEYK